MTVAADDDAKNFDNEDDFLKNAAEYYEPAGYKCYYFGGGDDGAMRTNKTTVSIDGENHNFYFEKSGGHKGAGITGEKDDKLYQSGMLLAADSDDKYIVVEKKTVTKDGKTTVTYSKLDDAKDFLENAKGVTVKDELDGNSGKDQVNVGNNTKKKAEDLSENQRGKKRTAAGKQLHGNLTPAHADGCAAQCFEGVQRGSIIIPNSESWPPCCHARLQTGLIARLSSYLDGS